MSDSNKMSIEEILAACRSKDGGQAGPAASKSEAQAAAEEDAGQGTAPLGKSAPKRGTPPGKKPSQMTVEEMLAAARSERAGAKTKAPAAKATKPSLKAKAAETSPAKVSPKTESAAKRSGPLDTASILVAARTSAKPGPMTKAEAAAKGQPVVTAAKAKPKVEVPPMPHKPAYARPAAPSATGEDRRGFFASLAGVFVGSSLAIGFSTLTLTNVLWALGLARFMFPNILTEPPTKFKVGFPGDYAPGQVESKYIPQFGVWVVHYEYEGVPQIYALQSVCTHLGCTPNWLEGEQKFKCPCHGSGFYKDGINFEGPAPRPLERFAIRLADDGQLEVDKSRKFFEEKGEWKDPASFVPV